MDADKLPSLAHYDCIAGLPRNARSALGTLDDFVTGKVIVYIKVKHKTSGLRRGHCNPRHHAGGLTTAMQRRRGPLLG